MVNSAATSRYARGSVAARKTYLWKNEKYQKERYERPGKTRPRWVNTPVGRQWELRGAVARKDRSYALGFFLNPGP